MLSILNGCHLISVYLKNPSTKCRKGENRSLISIEFKYLIYWMRQMPKEDEKNCIDWEKAHWISQQLGLWMFFCPFAFWTSSNREITRRSADGGRAEHKKPSADFGQTPPSVIVCISIFETFIIVTFIVNFRTFLYEIKKRVCVCFFVFCSHFVWMLHPVRDLGFTFYAENVREFETRGIKNRMKNIVLFRHF